MKTITRLLLLLAFAIPWQASAQQTGYERDASGNIIRGTSEFYLELIKGDVAKHSHVDKFGAANDIGTSWTVVTSSKQYRTPTSATALEILSDSDSDSTGNAGLNSLCIEGLGSGWQSLTECVTLRGTQAVAFDSSFIRVFRMYGQTAGAYASTAGSSQVGDLTLRESGGGQTWANLNSESSFGFGQSLIGAYTVPRGYTAYIESYEITTESTKTPAIALFKRCNADDVTAPYDGVMRLQSLHRGVGQPLEIWHKIALGPYVGPCDVGFFAKVGSGTADISVQFEIILVENGG